MGTYYVRPYTDAVPNDGTLIGGGTVHALAVDDPVGAPDESTTALQANGGGISEAWGLNPADLDAIPVRDRIDSVHAHFRWKAPGSGANSATVRAGLRLGGVDFFWTPVSSIDSAFHANATTPLLLNPSIADLSRYWLREDLRNGQARFEWTSVDSALPRSQVTQFYLEIATTPQPYDLAVERAVTGRIMQIPGLRGAGTRHRSIGETGNFPVAWTIPFEGVSDRGPTRSQEGIVSLRIACAVKGDDPFAEFMELRQSIQEEIDVDPSLDGLAFDCWVESWTYADLPESARGVIGVGDVNVAVHRRLTRGAP